jgi:hypothetical protein
MAVFCLSLRVGEPCASFARMVGPGRPPSVARNSRQPRPRWHTDTRCPRAEASRRDRRRPLAPARRGQKRSGSRPSRDCRPETHFAPARALTALQPAQAALGGSDGPGSVPWRVEGRRAPPTGHRAPRRSADAHGCSSWPRSAHLSSPTATEAGAVERAWSRRPLCVPADRTFACTRQ